MSHIDQLDHQTTARDPRRFSPRWEYAFAAAVFVISTLLGWQGWKNKWEAMDDRVINIDEAYKLVTTGRLPQIGGYASIGGFNPPGLSYLYALGLLSGDFRLNELIGPTLLHWAALLGIWKLTTLLSNRRTAILALALYSFSMLGIHFCSSLWPRANPACYVWMVYFVVRWVQQRSAWSLCAAWCCFAINTYIFLEALPGILAFPAVWYFYRPPLKLSAFSAAAAFTILLWYPYLEFEWQRGFIDLKHQLVTPQGIDYDAELSKFADSLQAYDPQTKEIGPYRPILVQESLDGFQNKLKKLFFKLYRAGKNVGALFANNHLPGLLAVALFLLPLLCWQRTQACVRLLMTRPRTVTALGIVLGCGGIACNPWTASFLLGRPLEAQELQKILLIMALLLGLAGLLVFHRKIERVYQQLLRIWSYDQEASEKRTAFDVMLLSFVPAWIVLTLLSEWSRYYWWLWGIEVLLVALAACYLPARRLRSPWWPILLSTLAFLSVASQGDPWTRVQRWREHGLAGYDLPYVLALNDIADDYRRQYPNSEEPLRVGYHIWLINYELVFTNYEDRYKVGAPLDQYLEIQHKLRNETRSKIGISPDDNYRLIELNSRRSFFYRTKLDGLENFERWKTYDGWEVWKRKPQN